VTLRVVVVVDVGRREIDPSDLVTLRVDGEIASRAVLAMLVSVAEIAHRYPRVTLSFEVGD
jgi:hypothetical protein